MSKKNQKQKQTKKTGQIKSVQAQHTVTIPTCDGAQYEVFVMALTSIHFCASRNAESAAESVTG